MPARTWKELKLQKKLPPKVELRNSHEIVFEFGGNCIQEVASFRVNHASRLYYRGPWNKVLG